MSFWVGVQRNLRTPIARVGLGGAAMIALAVGLWPIPGAEFSPDKAAAFAVPLFTWLYAELFTEPSALAPHDQELASRVYAAMPDNGIRYLQEHDFGASWLNARISPVFDLADLAHNPTSEFENKEIQAAFLKLRGSLVEVANRLTAEGNAVGPGGIISMVPHEERAMDFFSPETNARVQQMNQRTTELASEIVNFYRLLRSKGANLLAKEA
jgi:hypothetical protein